MHRPNRRQVGFIAGQNQGVFVYVQQVLIRGDQQRDSCEGGFRENQPVMKFILRDETLVLQSPGKPFRYDMMDRAGFRRVRERRV
jgi:hypothetical protein